MEDTTRILNPWNLCSANLKAPPATFFGTSKEKEMAKQKSNAYFNRNLPHPFPAIDALPLEPLVPLDPFEPPLLFPVRAKGSFFQDWGLINPPMLVWIDLGHMLTPQSSLRKRRIVKKYTCWLSPLSSHVNNTSFKPIADPFCQPLPLPFSSDLPLPWLPGQNNPRFFPDAFLQNIADHIRAQW